MIFSASVYDFLLLSALRHDVERYLQDLILLVQPPPLAAENFLSVMWAC
jgi:hypothetical protein